MEQISKRLMNWASILETNTREQAVTASTMPFIHPHIALMPDAHLGKGATVGSVIPTVGAIMPAAVGVDIGCGMMAQRTTLTSSDLPDNLHGLRTEIERRVPHGRTNNGGEGDRGAWGDAAPTAEIVARHFTLDDSYVVFRSNFN